MRQPVAVLGRPPGRHLEEHHRRGVPLGGRVNRPRARLIEERIQYGGVPAVTAVAPARASEKSNSTRCLARSLRPSRTPRLAGLMSRWSTPARSSATSASSRSVPHRSSRSRDSRSRLAQHLSQCLVAGWLQHQRGPAADLTGPSISRTRRGSRSAASTSASASSRAAAASSTATLSTRTRLGRHRRPPGRSRAGRRRSILAEPAFQPVPAVDHRAGRPPADRSPPRRRAVSAFSASASLAEERTDVAAAAR